MADFEELSGSPVESFSESSGPSVERQILVPFEDRLTRAEQLLGGLYPHFPHCRIHSFRMTPHHGEESVANGPAILNPLTNSADYSGKKTLMTMGYGPDFTQKQWPIGFTKPAFRVGTELRFQIRSGGEFLTIGSSAAKWEDDDDAAVLESVNTALLISRDIYTFQWDFVNVVPKAALDAMKGRVNETEFLGCAPETLLFQGYSVDETFKASTVNSHTNRVSIEILKKEFIADDSITYGWNHDYREDPAGWARILLSDGEPRYKLDDFTDMFL